MRAARRALSEEKCKEGSVDIIAVDRNFIRGLNLRFRGKDKPTDVLAFDLRGTSDKNHAGNFIPHPVSPKGRTGGIPLHESKRVKPWSFIGDVFICPDIAKEYIDSVLSGKASALLKKSSRKELITNELCLYAVHGILHLLGYSDKTPKAKKNMFKRQEEILIDAQNAPKIIPTRSRKLSSLEI